MKGLYRPLKNLNSVHTWTVVRNPPTKINHKYNLQLKGNTARRSLKLICKTPALMLKKNRSTFNISLSFFTVRTKAGICPHMGHKPPTSHPSLCFLASSISSLYKFLSLCISPSFQFKSDRCLSGTSELWSGSDESHKPGPTARPQLLVCQRKLPHLEAHPGTGAAF